MLFMVNQESEPSLVWPPSNSALSLSIMHDLFWIYSCRFFLTPMSRAGRRDLAVRLPSISLLKNHSKLCTLITCIHLFQIVLRIYSIYIYSIYNNCT